MQSSSERNGDGDASNSAIGRWTMPDSGAVFTMDAALIQRLRAYVLEGFHILPKRGAEMGGILLGRVVEEAPLAIEVTDFEPVPCEYRFGPSYVLSDTDRGNLEQALARWKDQPASMVVGYFRSCTGRDLALDNADEELMGAYFPDPRQVLLSIKPISILECVAWFFCRQNGVLPRLPCGTPEPFGRPISKDRTEERGTAPAPMEMRRAARAGASSDIQDSAPVEMRQAAHAEASSVANETPRTTPATASAPARVEDPPEQPDAWRMVEERRHLREQQAEPRKHHLWQLITLLVLLLVGAGVGHQWWDAQRRARWSSLGLDAKPGPAGIDVSWNRHSPALREASRAVLEISEGGKVSQVELDAKALSLGGISYPSSGGDASFRLQVYGLGLENAVESVRLVSSGKKDVITSSVASGARQKRAKRAASQNEASPAAAAEPEPVQPAPTQAGNALAAAPSTKPATSPASSLTASLTKSQPPTEAPAPAEAQSAEAPPPAVPATAIREIQPIIPEGVRNRIRYPITVPVEVSIDARGRVTKAAAQGDGDGVYRYLAERATAAAQSWKFRPARTGNGAAVPTTKVLYFNFKG